MDRLPKVKVCWLDAAAITNFEASTLPLLYAPEEDCKHYFQAMKRKNPRKGLMLESIYALCLEARAAKQAGRYLDAVKKLREGALKRLEIFHALDYQTVAAFEHCAWAAIHLAVLDLADPGSNASNSSASSLYQFAADLLREMKSPETHVEITPFVRTLLEFSVHYNWTSYYVHRSKWHAALQQATLAELRWRKLTSTSSEATRTVSHFVTVRRMIVQERVDPEHSDALFEELGELLEAIGPYNRESSAPVEAASPVDASAVDEQEAPADNVESAPSCLTVIVAKEGEEREVTLCIGASKSRFAWNGPLEVATKFLAHFTMCMMDHSRTKYRRCLQAIQQQRLHSELPENSTWSDAATLLMQLCATKIELVESMCENVHPMPKEMTRSSEGLSVQRVLKKYITSERDKRQRLRMESERKKQVLDDGVDDDEDPAVTEAKWRIPPTKSEVDGLLLEEGKLNPAVAAFTAMIPVMKKALPTQQALKALEASAIRITSPMIAVREALATRHTISPPRRQAFTPDPVSKVLPAAPVEVRAASSQCHQAKENDSIPKRRPPSPNAAISKVESVYRDSNRKTRFVEKSTSATPAAVVVGATTNSLTVNPAEDRAIILDDALREFTVSESEKAIEIIQRYHRENRLEEKLDSFVDTLRKLTEAHKLTSEQYRRLDDRVPLLIAAYDTETEARAKAAKPVSPPKRRQSPLARVHPDRSVSPPMVIPPPSASPAKMQPAPPLPSESLIENHTDIHEKQRQLRAMLPSIDHHSKAYRLVVKELADNEKILQHQRDLETLSQLTKSAEAGMARRATRGGSVQSGLLSFNGSFAGGVPSLKEGCGESPQEDSNALSAVTAATFLSILAFGSMSTPPAPSTVAAD